MSRANEDFSEFPQTDQKQKEEVDFLTSNWNTAHSPGSLTANNLGSIEQLSSGNQLDVQSQMSPTIQTAIKSGTSNTINPYKVLPPVTPTGSSHLAQEDFLLPPGSAMSTISGFSGLSPFGLSPTGSNFVSPRHSAKSNSRSLFSAARKRTLSVSPLSMDGIDLNALIRVSPSSLLLSGSLNASPLPPIGTNSMDHSGTYGHLNARSALTPSSGTLSRQLLAATPASMIMPVEQSAAPVDEFMSGAYVNVIGHQHLKQYNDGYYHMESFFPSSSNLTVQHPDLNFHRVQKNKKEEIDQTTSCQQNTSIVTHDKIDNLLRISDANSNPSSSVHCVYSVPVNTSRVNSNTLNVTHEHYRDLQAQVANSSNTAKSSTAGVQSGAEKKWICQWIDCNLIFKVRL